jgi:hypothetical protein
MRWRDEQPEYQAALREVLSYAEKAEQAGDESQVENEWRAARENLLAVERTLLARWEQERERS